MNSKSLQYHQTAGSAIQMPALPRKHSLVALARTVIGWFARSDLEQAQARYRIKRERATRTGATQDIVRSMPLEQKHHLGLYRMMD